MVRIAIFNSNIGIGGISKSLLNLLDYLDDESFSIDLYLFQKVIIPNGLPSNVNIIYQDRYHILLRLIPFEILRIVFLKTGKCSQEKYDYSIDYNGYWIECTIGAILCGSNTKICWIHSDLRERIKQNKKYRLLYFLLKGKYKYFDQYVAVSNGAAEALIEIAKVSRMKVNVIPNIVKSCEIIKKSNEIIEFKVIRNLYNLVTVGSLIYSKGIDIVLSRIKDVIVYRNDIHLYIIGDGPYKKDLQKLADNYNITKYVTFLGELHNPYSYMKQMDGFIFESRYEGQGIVLYEAKVLGLDIYMPCRLEKYAEEIKGRNDITADLVSAKKSLKTNDLLIEYNKKCQSSIENLLGRGKGVKGD